MSFLTNKGKAFLALLPVTALTFLDQTILPVALPTIQRSLKAQETALQWSINAYLLTIAVFVLLAGKIGDKIGSKKNLLGGMFFFVLSSIFCSLSPNIEILVIARALQGISAAFMFPSQTAMIAHIFPPEQRGRATGFLISVGSLFLVLGPLIGGYLIEVASWPWIFWINVPIGGIGLWMIYAFLPGSEKGKGQIDFIGFFLFGLGISALTVVFMEAPNWGWGSKWTLSSLIVAILGLASGLLREKKAKHPFLDLSLFRIRTYATININVFIIQFFLMISVFRTIYFQTILEYSPFETGGIILFSSSPTLFMASIAGHLSDRFNPRLPIALGYLCLIFSSFWFAFFSTSSFLVLTPALFAFGTGLTFIFTPSYSSAVNSVPKPKRNTALGMIMTLRMTGGTIGLALIHLFTYSVQKHYTPIQGARSAEILSFSYVHFALACLLIITFAITFLLENKKSRGAPPSFGEGWN